jgi:hypothetical protein
LFHNLIDHGFGTALFADPYGRFEVLHRSVRLI